MSIRLKPLSLTLIAALLVAWLSYRQSYRPHAVAVAPNVKIALSASGRESREMVMRVDKVEQLRGLLGKPFNFRSSTEAWDIISGMSVAQIQQTLDAIPREKESESAQNMARSLYFRWAQIDPTQAIAAAALEEKKEDADRSPNLLYVLGSAYYAWFKQDPEAAFRWLQTASPELQQSYSYLMGRYLATLPPTEAEEKMKNYGPTVAKEAISCLGLGMMSSPEDRKAFLDRVANSGMTAADSKEVLKRFVRSWGSADPASALAGLDGIPLNDGERSDARQRIIADWVDKKPAEAFAWATKDGTPNARADQMFIYEKWVASSPEEALTAFDDISSRSPGFREEVMKSQLESYYQGNWRSDYLETYLFDRLKKNYDHWAASAPSDAEKWLGTLEPSLQQQLHTSADEKH